MLLWATIAASVAAQAAQQQRSNVLYLIADDLRPEIAGGYGQSQIHTPNIDKLAASGTVFEKAYCQQAVCGASRNSFMTGRRPHHTNVVSGMTGDDFRKSGRDSNGNGSAWITMPEHFKQHNFSVLGGGKTFHPNNPPHFDYPTSWSDWTETPGVFGSNYYDYSYWLTNKTTKVDYAGPCPGHAKPDPSAPGGDSTAGLAGPIAVWCALDEPDEHFYDYGLANNTIERLRYAAAQWKESRTPFFVQSGFARPHTPWRVPQRYWDLYKTNEIVLAKHKLPPADMPGVAWMAHSFFNASSGAVWPLSVTKPLADPIARLARHGYFASVSWLDAQIGRILDELDALSLTDSTVVVLHGDHGWQLGEHNSWHKYTNFEIGTRVPLIIRAPMVPASTGQTAKGLAELIDVYPTLASLAGTPPPSDRLDGVSLMPFFLDPTSTSLPTDPAHSGTHNKQYAFSQYPHADAPICPAVACPYFGADGSCHQAPSATSTAGSDSGSDAASRHGPQNTSAAAKPAFSGSHSSVAEGKGNTTRMGFSVRSQEGWRYTIWLPYNGSIAQWPASYAEVLRGRNGSGSMNNGAGAGAGVVATTTVEELYDHRALQGYHPDDMDTVNLAYDPSHTSTCAQLFAVARNLFYVLMPPTWTPSTPIAPGCESFCNKHDQKNHTWAEKCKWIHCAACPQCNKTAAAESWERLYL